VFAQKEQVVEASGVARSGNNLFVVDDSVGGVCFRLRLPADPKGVMSLNAMGPQRVRLAGGRLAIDLEGIDFLADGRLAVVSERTRTLIGEEDTIAEYDQPFSEFAKRGLEGVSARPIGDETSRIAVVWEGGYPDPPSVPIPLRRWVGRKALNPMLFIHDLKRGVKDARVRLTDGMFAEVQVPRPPGAEPQAQRFRASDLTWTRLPGDQWGLILLISSQNSALKPLYQFHWLQRFTVQGKPIGAPVDIDKLTPASSRGANWEGVAWFEPGRRVIIVHEAEPNLEAHAMVIDLPADWQFGGDAGPSANHVK